MKQVGKQEALLHIVTEDSPPAENQKIANETDLDIFIADHAGVGW